MQNLTHSYHPAGATTLAGATITTLLYYCNSLRTALPASTLAPSLSIPHTAATAILSNMKVRLFYSPAHNSPAIPHRTQRKRQNLYSGLQNPVCSDPAPCLSSTSLPTTLFLVGSYLPPDTLASLIVL